MATLNLDAIAREYHAHPKTSASARRAYQLLAHYTESRFADLLKAGWDIYPTYSDTPPDLTTYRLVQA